MKIDFQETTNDLLKRIDIHNQFGARNIDQWMLELLPLKTGMKILDVGCGAGKQCFSYYTALQGQAEITGTDVNQDLLDQAKKENAKYQNAVKFTDQDFNQTFKFEDDTFDLESCCFAIYYAQDIPFTIKEMHRVLKPGGSLFTTGPMPTNKQFFYDVIREATGKTIPPMPGSSRYGSLILDEIKKNFSSVNVAIFENPLTFTSVTPFMEYARASMTEDRKLWNSFFESHAEFEEIMQKMTTVAEKHLQSGGKLVMTKIVGGFLAVK